MARIASTAATAAPMAIPMVEPVLDLGVILSWLTVGKLVVTVCVMMEPPTVTTWTEVTGDPVIDGLATLGEVCKRPDS